jgi:transcriptional regulator with XRE-family HTH domain
MYISENIKFLRKRKKITQFDLADNLKIKRSSINNYENGIAIPPIDIIIRISDYFGLSIDTMIKVNLSKLRESQLYQIEHGSDIFLKGNQIRILTTTVDSQNNENIELVSIKAKAGYSTGYFDPEYISGLPVFNLPFLSKNKKYRTFQISGDSMLPIPDKSWVTGEFVQDITQLKNNELYIVTTLNEGVLFKRILNEIRERGSLKMISINPEYNPFDLPVAEVREVWKFVHYISEEVPEGFELLQMQYDIRKIQQDINDLKLKI